MKIVMSQSSIASAFVSPLLIRHLTIFHSASEATRCLHLSNRILPVDVPKTTLGVVLCEGALTGGTGMPDHVALCATGLDNFTARILTPAVARILRPPSSAQSSWLDRLAKVVTPTSCSAHMTNVY